MLARSPRCFNRVIISISNFYSLLGVCVLFPSSKSVWRLLFHSRFMIIFYLRLFDFVLRFVVVVAAALCIHTASVYVAYIV